MKTLRGIIALGLVLVGTAPAWATTSCPSFDVRDICCPSACEARRHPGSRETAILQACMRGLGCSEDESSHATIFQMCSCK